MSEPIQSYGYNRSLRQGHFDGAVNSPGPWIFSALDLRTAADRVNWLDSPVRHDEPSPGLTSVYRMLIGMSMEALLKGMMVAQGEQVVTNGVFNPEFETHKLSRLAKRIDASAFVFTQDDKKILRNLEPYIIWAGKYPFPKKPEQLVVQGHSSIEVALELKLWDRLYDHLRAVGWVTKGGKRLPLTQRFDSTEPSANP